MTDKQYIVTFKEVAIVTEFVEASSSREAIEQVKNGLGDRIDFEIDDMRGPTAFKAKRYREEE